MGRRITLPIPDPIVHLVLCYLVVVEGSRVAGMGHWHMGMGPTDESAGSYSPDSGVTGVQRLLLYFNSRRRKTIAVLAAIAGWFAVIFLASTFAHGAFLNVLPNIYFYVAVFTLWLLFTQGAMLRRPVRLPVGVMRRTAEWRFSQEESWSSTRTGQEVLDTLAALFNQAGSVARVVGTTVWVEMGKEWRAGSWRHANAAQYMKIHPTVHFFVDELETGSCVIAFSCDRRLMGMWDVLKLSDEMADTAVRLAREATTP